MNLRSSSVRFVHFTFYQIGDYYPLYDNEIPTPEATPKQQKERNKYWKRINFMLS